jgi:hypothetical protein
MAKDSQGEWGIFEFSRPRGTSLLVLFRFLRWLASDEILERLSVLSKIMQPPRRPCRAREIGHPRGLSKLARQLSDLLQMRTKQLPSVGWCRFALR